MHILERFRKFYTSKKKCEINTYFTKIVIDILKLKNKNSLYFN